MADTGDVKVCADGVMLSAGYGKIAAYHGGRYPGGTILAYKALRLAQELLFPNGGFFVRGKCSVETPFTGLGFKDGMEAVLRAPSLGLYKVDTDMPVPRGTVPAPIRGAFFYRFVQDGGTVDLTLKPGLIPEEFYRATEGLHSGKITSEDEVLKIRRGIESALMGLSPGDIFDAVSCRPCGVTPDEYEEPPPLDDDFRVRLNDFAEYDVGVDDARFFHGDESLCGLCLVWSLVRQWIRGDARLQNSCLPRRSVSVAIGALGRGVNDAFEFLFRTSDGRSSVNIKWSAGFGAPEVMPGAGFFAFGLGLEGERRSVFALKERIVPRDYLKICGEMAGKAADFRERAARKKLQRDFVRQVLSEPEPFRVVA
ncbi:MAG: hypothetical protein LBR87_07280 [Synergistaceae bacterium]|jgi:hypothetical protein|nr:hypothetical protein [Synergistaceae bacterium]